MPDAYFALGTTLAALANVETITEYAPHVLPSQTIPLQGPVARRVLSGAVARNGAVVMPMQWDIMKLSALRSLLTTYWSYTTASASLYASWLDETGHYSPFAVTVSRPYPGDDYQINDQTWAKQISLTAYNWTLQSVTKTGDYTVTTSDRLVYANTAGGNIVLTLPAANAVNANTVFSAAKTAAGNTLTVQRAGADTVNGGTNTTATALNARIDLISNGVSAWVTI
jgi:hypothetical protein